MYSLLDIQLKKIYKDEYNEIKKDKKFQAFLHLIEDAYKDYEEDAKLLDHTLSENARELEETNKLLLEKEQLRQNIEDSLIDAVFYKDLNHVYRDCNKSFAEFLGFDKKDIIGKTDFDFFDKQIAQHYMDENNKIIKNKTKLVYRQWVEYKGEKYYVLTSKTPVYDNLGNVLGIVSSSKDITQEYNLQKDIEQKEIMLIQQNKLISMGEMIANIAHQWRQPLNTLGIIIQQIELYHQKDLLTAEILKDKVMNAKLLLESMSQTIENFSNFFNKKHTLENFDLHDAFTQPLKILQTLLEKNNITVYHNIQKGCFIHGYKNDFFQVIINLLNNAIEALVENKIDDPQIQINFQKKRSHIIITMEDNANGIPENIIDKIFDPYFTTKEGGTGLGLYMSKIIIHNHMKGTINVENSNKGTKFTIRLRGGEILL